MIVNIYQDSFNSGSGGGGESIAATDTTSIGLKKTKKKALYNKYTYRFDESLSVDGEGWVSPWLRIIQQGATTHYAAIRFIVNFMDMKFGLEYSIDNSINDDISRNMLSYTNEDTIEYFGGILIIESDFANKTAIVYERMSTDVPGGRVEFGSNDKFVLVSQENAVEHEYTDIEVDDAAVIVVFNAKDICQNITRYIAEHRSISAKRFFVVTCQHVLNFRYGGGDYDTYFDSNDGTNKCLVYYYNPNAIPTLWKQDWGTMPTA